MLTVILIMTAGMIIGYLFRSKKKLIKISNKSVIWVIFILLFFMGLSVGGNNEIMTNLDTIGFRGLELSLAAVFGSVLLSWGVYMLFFKQKESLKNER
ncbi:MAG: LysO family transporter [Salinivirgaceae bacterium]|nr:LysO family transporter [Salinivirgaceae bacterium]